MSVSKTILIGNMGKNIEVRVSQQGKKLGSFSFATTENWKDQSGTKQSKTSWHNISVFQEPLVNLLEQYTNKGSKLYIEGQLDYQEYEKDGQKKYITKIIARQIQMLDKKGDSSGAYAEPARPVQPKQEFAVEDLDDSIPF